MALRHDSELDPDVEVELLTRNENDEISAYILSLLKESVALHWREISKFVRAKYTVSIERLQNIIRELVHSDQIVELPCRFFMLQEIFTTIPLEELIRIIEEKIKTLNLSRCSPPLASAKHPFKFRISRTSKNGLSLIIL